MNKEEILQVAKSRAAIMTSSNKEFSFSVDINGYSGEFTMKYPSLIEKMNIGVLRAKFLDGVEVGKADTVTDNIAYITATFMVVCKNAPKWWNMDTLDDYEVMMGVWKEYDTAVSSFRSGNDSGGNTGSSQE